MARTPQGAQLTVVHRQKQIALRAALIAEINKAFPGWQFADDVSYQMLEASMAYLVREGSEKSAALAANYYRLFRQLEAPGAAALPELTLAGPPPLEQIRTALRVTSQVAVAKSLEAGMPMRDAMTNALVKVSGSMSRLSLNAGRDTIHAAIDADDECLGYARVTSGDPCAFCAMLASRGPVYKKETVLYTKGGRKYHDHCSCTDEPVYSGSAWPGRAQEFRDIWSQTGSLDMFRAALKEQAAVTAA